VLSVTPWRSFFQAIQSYPDRHKEDAPAGKSVAFCRCWQASEFPYCDGAHRKVTAENGDNAGPAIVTGVVTE